MALAYHVIFTAYGFWLPNDPRGSWSDFVRSWELYRFGPATHAPSRSDDALFNGVASRRASGPRKSVARSPHSYAQRQAAKSALKYPPVSFTGQQCLAIAHGFKDAIRRSHFKLYACSILPEHVHLVVARHTYHVEKIRDQLKGQ